jgi:hypothetical protein
MSKTTFQKMVDNAKNAHTTIIEGAAEVVRVMHVIKDDEERKAAARLEVDLKDAAVLKKDLIAQLTEQGK